MWVGRSSQVIFLLHFIYFFVTFSKGNIYIYPFEGYFGNKLFEGDDPYYNTDDRNRPFFTLFEALKAKGFELQITHLDKHLENFNGLIVCHRPNQQQLNLLSIYPKDKIILLLLEPDSTYPNYYEKEYHKYFGKILTMFDNDVDNIKYFKLFFPQATLQLNDHYIPFKQKKFCVLIATNKYSQHQSELYSQRRNIINFFNEKSSEKLDLYGRNWNGNLYGNYKGFVTTKKQIMSNYKFCICYENMANNHGYITEKIFDVFINNCVPIYWGADNITDYIPKECFIDRRNFKNDEELYHFLNSITETRYLKYLENIKNFLISEKAYFFSQEFFIQKLFHLLEID